MRFRRRLSPDATVNMIPMIDVVFQLIIFFMVASTFIVTPGISLVLPSSSTSEPVAMTKLVVTVLAENSFYLNKEPCDAAGLDRALAKIGKEERDAIKTVVVEGNKDVSYEVMVMVLDILRSRGFKGVNLKTLEATSGP